MKIIRFFIIPFLMVMFTGCVIKTTFDEETDNSIPAEWTQWVKDNHQPLNNPSSEDFSDLQFLKTTLAGRTIVQLGESSHGVKEYSQMKIRLIKFLHQEMNFDIIAFESSLFSCYFNYHVEPPGSAKLLMGNTIFGTWWTEEVLDLFRYIRIAKQSENPLILAGIDVQPTGMHRYNHSSFLAKLLFKINPTYADYVFKKDKNILLDSYAVTFNYDYSRYKEYIRANRFEFIEFYQDLYEFLDINTIQLLNQLPPKSKDVDLAKQSIKGMIHFIKEISSTNINDLYQYRDIGCADNVKFLAETLYPGKKIIIWAHNAHIAHSREDFGKNYPVMMGSRLFQNFRENLFTIGLYMYKGNSIHVNGQGYEISPPFIANGLEAILHEAGSNYLFIDLLNNTKNPGNSWMFQLISTRDGGNSEEPMIVRNQYDGILYFETVNAIEYISPWQ